MTPDSQKIGVIGALFDRLVYQNTDTAQFLARQAIDISKRLQMPAEEANSWYKVGMSHAIKGNYPSAIEAFLTTHEIFSSIDHQTGIAFAEKGLGNIHQMMGNMEEAISYFRKSLMRYRIDGDSGRINAAINSLALGFQQAEMLDSAVFYFEERVALSGQMGYLSAQASSLNNLGSAYKAQERYDLAEAHFIQSLLIRREQKALKYEALVLGNLADLYRIQKKYAESATAFQESIDIREQIGDRRGVALNSNRLAQTLMEIGDYSGARSASEKSASIAQELGFLDYELDAIGRLKNIYQASGNYQKAFQASERFSILKDSILNVEKAGQIAEMETKYNVQLKEQQLDLQQKEISLLEEKNRVHARLKFVLIAAGALLLSLLSLVLNRYQMKRRNEKELTDKNEKINLINREIRTINKELERKMLRAQMDPHFIFNSLNSIQHFITINEKELAIRYLSKFAKLIRRVLDNSISDRVPLSDELSLLEDYMELEELRLNHSFSHQIEIDRKIDLHNTEVPFLIIQPYVENAIKHGLKQSVRPGKLKIKLEDGGEHLRCYIEDNGIGREASKTLAEARVHQSHGMSVTKKRLEALNNANENQTLVEIFDLKNENGEAVGTQVALTIPYDLN
jgi:tetratricopeptide (TPR) repeat protein